MKCAPEDVPPADVQTTRRVWAHLSRVQCEGVSPAPSVREVAAALGLTPAMTRRAINALHVQCYVDSVPRKPGTLRVLLPLVEASQER